MVRTSPSLALVLVLVLAAGPALAATKTVTVDCQSARSSGPRYPHRHTEFRCPHSFSFAMEILSDDEGPKPLSERAGRPFMIVRPGERYSVKLHNPLPVRAAVNLTVDGLNTLTGQPGLPDSGSKWIIEPHSYVVIKGWQVGSHSARRFYFVGKEASYAKWRSNTWSTDLSVNCGVIGAAFFWSSAELAEHLQHYKEPMPVAGALSSEAPSGRAFDGVRRSKSESQPRAAFSAGTGMGERRSNPVQEVRFSYDAGMYSPREALLVYYDFSEARVYPVEPLEHRHDHGSGYAPEMPQPWEGRRSRQR